MYKLPSELRAIILQLHPPRQLPPPTLSFRRTLSFAARASTLPREKDSVSDRPPHAASPSNANLFETPTPEYAVVPLSTLDHPVARTPHQALAGLVEARRLDEADAILSDLLASNSSHSLHLNPQLLRAEYLARHTIRLFCENRDSNWSSWWRLTHYVPEEIWLKGQYSYHANTSRICAQLIVDGNIERMEAFAFVAAEAGYERLVSERFLVYLALYAERQVGEQLFHHLVDCVKQRKYKVRKALRTSNISHKAVQIAEELLQRRVAADEHYLASKRGDMLRAHLSMGRLEFAVSLLPQRDQVDNLGTPLYLDILEHAAAADRFDLFVLTFRSMEEHSLRLVRAIASPGSAKERKAWFLRRQSDTSVQGQADLESIRATFDSYLAPHNVGTTPPNVSSSTGVTAANIISSTSSPPNSPAGVGPPALHLLGAHFSGIHLPSSSEKIAPRLHRPISASPPSPPSPQTAISPSTTGLDEILDGISAKTASPQQRIRREFHRHTTDADLSNALAVEDVSSATKLFANSVRSGWTPSLTTASLFVQALRAQGHTQEVSVTAISNAFIASNESRWMGRFWETAVILADIREGKHKNAVKRLTRSFQLAGLPKVIRDAFLFTAPPTPTPFKAIASVPRLLPLPSHTLSVAFEALVPHMISNASSQGAVRRTIPPIIDELYAILSSPASEFNILRPASNPSGTSPLSPSTFLPFLNAFAKARRPPLALLQVLHDMQQLGLVCSKQHWGIVLGAYARSGSAADTLAIVDILEGRELSAQPSPETHELLRKLKLPKEAPDIVAYTSMIKGFTLQKEYDAAWDVAGRLPTKARRGDEVLAQALALLERFEGNGNRLEQERS
ncbi:hypothetical protein P7C70_g3501, partial [Phenoliferia sp. Uapishka_3]